MKNAFRGAMGPAQKDRRRGTDLKPILAGTGISGGRVSKSTGSIGVGSA